MWWIANIYTKRAFLFSLVFFSLSLSLCVCVCARNTHVLYVVQLIFLTPTPLGNENSARTFSDRSFWKPLRVVDVRAFGSWMSAPKCLFFSRILTALTEVLGRDIRANDPPDVRGMSVPQTSSLGWFFVLDPCHGRPAFPPGSLRAQTVKFCAPLLFFLSKVFLKSASKYPLKRGQKESVKVIYNLWAHFCLVRLPSDTKSLRK